MQPARPGPAALEASRDPSALLDNSGRKLPPQHPSRPALSPTWGLACAGVLFLLGPRWGAAQLAPQPGDSLQATILDVQGRVEVRRAGVTNWEPVRAQQTLRLNDQVRTRENSFVAVCVGQREPVRFGEMTDFTFRAPAAPGQPARLNLWRGLLYFLGREKPARLQLDSPVCATAIRGTEFVLEVQENQRTILTLLEGEAEVRTARTNTLVKGGQQAVTEPGRDPFLTVGFTAINVIQWCLYYPAVLDLTELPLTAAEQAVLRDSLAAYRAGDLRQALASYPSGRTPASASERIYLGALLLAVGQVEKAEPLLAPLAVAAASGPPDVLSRLAQALRRMIATMKSQALPPGAAPELATEWLAESYAAQARPERAGSLDAALQAARKTVAKSTNFGFGWVRVAELEFSFGRNRSAHAALEQALALTPRNAQAVALQGFLLAGRNHLSEAIKQFDRAISLDGRLANAWLGRGLCRIRQGRARDGRADLLTATAVEPQRAVLRSYLGKAEGDAGDAAGAARELERARELDPQDPTRWLYSALLLSRQNRINEAIRDLEKSQEFNDNRSLYRSEFLLDQDRAVRSANLARLYQDAGLDDVAFREAVKAVQADYANYSAHLFLANSYQQLQDPNGFNLRYETGANAEYLLANLLAPADAGLLSPAISQQEYSKLFQHDGLGVVSSTEYLSRGAWTEAGTQYGQFGNTSYSLDAYYRSDPGQRPNNDVEQRNLSLSLKHQWSAYDTVLLQVQQAEASGGDLSQRYDPGVYAPNYRFTETQDPSVSMGYHHAWGPGSDTLFLASYVPAELSLTNPTQPTLLAFRPAGDWAALYDIGMSEHLRIAPTIYSAELQQILTGRRWSTIVGARFQYGNFHVNALQNQPPSDLGQSFDPGNPDRIQEMDPTFHRWTAYAYQTWRILDPLQLIGGITYDHLTYPENFRDAPVSDQEVTRDQVSPKAGFVWTPSKNTTLRGAYTRSVAGPSLDQSITLEPAQVAGFLQSYRSLIPESLTGAKTGARFETFGLAFEQKICTGTYFGLGGEVLYSKVDQSVGGYDAIPLDGSAWAVPLQLQQHLEYRERALVATVHQLLGDNFALGARYRLGQGQLKTDFHDVPDEAATDQFSPRQDLESVLQQLSLNAIFNHPCGFFAQLQGLWNQQNNRNDLASQPGSDFWQLNALAGYRLWQRRAEFSLGLLNVLDQDYRLSPLTSYSDLPRARTLLVRFRLSF